ncbi:hypothetical protein SRHO_G00169130 [Serrasalmus rhombeus]
MANHHQKLHFVLVQGVVLSLIQVWETGPKAELWSDPGSPSGGKGEKETQGLEEEQTGDEAQAGSEIKQACRMR